MTVDDENSPFATPVAPKRKGGLSDAAHAELQAAILDCRLAPGTNVSEVELSQRFAFGLAPVRAAVTRLAQAGWIAADGRRGSVVLPVSAAHLEDLRASRHCLEPALTAHPPPAPLAAELRLRATIHASGANKTGTADPRTLLHQDRALMALIAECLAAPRMRRWLLDSWDLSLRADRYLYDSFGVRRLPLPLADLACALADGDESRGHSILRQMRDAFALRISRALNAGVYPSGFLLDVDAAEWDRIFDINLRAPFLLTRGIATQMVRQKVQGNIVMISSGASRKMRTTAAPYSISKTALDRLTKGFAVELAEYGIRCNAVEPGFAAGSTASPLTEAHVKAVTGSVPLGRASRYEDAPAAVMFLASDAASYITGATLSVDGGGSAGTILVHQDKKKAL